MEELGWWLRYELSPVGAGRIARYVAPLASLVLAGGTLAPTAFAVTGLPATVVDYTPDSTAVHSFATTDYSGADARTGTTSWRIVTGTGNGAEHLITATKAGRLLDLGGRYVNYTDDQGKTWKSVHPTYPLLNAEGAVVSAPNGDILGVTWDPYSGDHMITYKFDAASSAWSWIDDPVHTPFYDRPEIGVVPGPIKVGGAQLPYLAFITSHGTPTFYSTDGLTYYTPIQEGAGVSEYLPTGHNASLDWAETQVWSPVHALANGWGLDLGGGSVSGDFSPADKISKLNLFSPTDLSWHPLTLPESGETQLTPNVQVDSMGRLHEVVLRANGNGFDYKVSADGGKTWKALGVDYPAYQNINDNTGGPTLDLRVNAALGIAAVATRTNVGTAAHPPANGSPQQDWVYKFDVTGARPKLIRRYAVGLGNTTNDTAYIGTYETGGHRYDFASLAILPDGRIVTSMMDESTKSAFPLTGLPIVAPGLAIEQETQLPGPKAPVTTPSGGSTAVLPNTSGGAGWPLAVVVGAFAVALAAFRRGRRARA